ncbi:exodeoxyribonuclease VII large subunit [Algiphilus sp.]|uniref:exodeoxyribonuclease VII large subunit n=2 Tax=Algiphilus sp. TaxID=1872431 RepID=UPI0025B90DBA|nr:exodeoxyribonuclease VII large subunit [Algiphilus sp.]MCK5769577.1 exodeoxyribonuclease VII large subunit [Algiphilus sp.]
MASARTARSYTVSEVAGLLADTLRANFPTLRVTGEISNFFRARSGHWYFRIKDDRAQIECAMFASDARGVAFSPADGDEVEISGQLDYYAPNGKLQIKCRTMQRGGEGRLLAAFEALKKRLAAEGLFEEAHKRPLPTFPRAVGLVTSSDAAALRDILTTLERRWPMVPLVLLPVLVQGERAAPQIAAALAQLPERAPEVDVIVLARGGGSIEDLWAFNEEIVARAIRACAVPVVTGVGHETDTTIADFAADLRAPTPTGAAERVAPDQQAVAQRVAQLRNRLARAEQLAGEARGQRLDALTRRLARVSPLMRLQTLDRRRIELSQRLTGIARRQAGTDSSRARALGALRERLHRAARAQIQRQYARLERERSLLRAHNPHRRLTVDAPARIAQARAALRRATAQRLENQRQRLRTAQTGLRQLGPQSTLGRGYAIVQHGDDGAILRDPAHTHTGAPLRLRLARGSLGAIAGEPLSERNGDEGENKP